MRDSLEIAPPPPASAPLAASPMGAPAPSRAAVRKALALGLFAALIWGGYLAYSRYGVTQGLEPPDFALLRYGVAGLVMLPWLLRRGFFTLAGVGWPHGLVLTFCAGPLFMLLLSAGYLFAPLAHGTVIPPSVMVVSTMLLAGLVLGDWPPKTRLIGIAVIVTGLACVAGGGLLTSKGEQTWIGDILFATAAPLWAVFTVLQRRWGHTPMQATAVMSVLSMLFLLPPFVIFAGFDRLLAIPRHDLVLQIVVQGLLSGVLAVVAFAAAVQLLGASRSAVFPALVPGTGILIGIPLTGEWPSPLQWLGIGLVTAGLIVALGVKLPFVARRRAR